MINIGRIDMCAWIEELIEYIGISGIDFAILLVSIIAVIISFFALNFAKKAFTLSLFDKRYNFYHRLKFLIEVRDTGDLFEQEKHMNELISLLWESKFIFGSEIEELLIELNTLQSSVVEAGQDIGRFHVVRGVITARFRELSGKNDKSKSLDSYFDKYLSDKDFKKA
jgi:hypothetical protein